MTARTPEASTVPEPFGKPSGPGLWHVKGMQLPAYIQHVAHELLKNGGVGTEQEAIQRAVSIVRKWSQGIPVGGETKVGGKDKHPGHIHPDVRAAAQKAMAEWEEKRAQAHAQSAAKEHSMVRENTDLSWNDPGLWSDIDPREIELARNKSYASVNARDTTAREPVHFETGQHSTEIPGGAANTTGRTSTSDRLANSDRRKPPTDPGMENDPRLGQLAKVADAGYRDTFAGTDEAARKSKTMFKPQLGDADDFEEVEDDIWDDPATWSAIKSRSDWLMSNEDWERELSLAYARADSVASVWEDAPAHRVTEADNFDQADENRLEARNQKRNRQQKGTRRSSEGGSPSGEPIGGFSHPMSMEMPHIRSTQLSNDQQGWEDCLDLALTQDELQTTDLSQEPEEEPTDLAVPAAVRAKAHAAGAALPPLHGGGPGKARFPMTNKTLAGRAVHMVGLAKGDKKAIRRYIMGQLRAHGWTDLKPDNWNSDGSVGGASKSMARRRREDGEGEQEMAREEPEEEVFDQEDEPEPDPEPEMAELARGKQDDDDDDDKEDEEDEEDEDEDEEEDDDEEPAPRGKGSKNMAHRPGSDVKKDDLIPVVAVDRDKANGNGGKKLARHKLTPDEMRQGRAKAGIGKNR